MNFKLEFWQNCIISIFMLLPNVLMKFSKISILAKKTS